MSTEDIILRCARETFYSKGLAGARMQEIADKAGINKAMLHYYFKTKELLFQKVFLQAFEVFAGAIADVLNGDLPLEEKIAAYVNYTSDALAADPGLPVFVLHELSQNPGLITAAFAGKDRISLDKFREQVAERSQGKVDPDVLFMDMVALCVYPFIIAPVFKKLLHQTDVQYRATLESRKTHVIHEIINKLH